MRKGQGWLLQTSWCWNPLFLQLSIWARSSCSYKPPTKHVILCSATFYFCINGLFKIRALRIGYPAYFRLSTIFFFKKHRASMTKHRQQSSEVKSKRNRGNLESDCSLLQSYEIVGWHHRLNGHEFEQILGDGGQGSLVCCSPLGTKSWTWVSDWTTTITELLNDCWLTRGCHPDGGSHTGLLSSAFSHILLNSYVNAVCEYIKLMLIRFVNNSRLRWLANTLYDRIKTWKYFDRLLLTGWNLLFSCQVVYNFLGLHGLQHARLPWPSISPRVCSNSCPMSQWCHPTITSSVAPFSSCPQSFPVSGSFPMSRL